MPGLKYKKLILFPSARPLSSEAQAYFLNCTTQPSDSFKRLMDNYLFAPLVSNGIFSLLDRLWVMSTEVQDNSLTSLANPTATKMTLINSPTWTQYQGFDWNGSSQYANTQWTPSVSPVNFLQESASMFCYLRENTQSGCDIGSNDVANAKAAQIWARFTDDKFYEGLNDNGAGSSVANTDSRGLFHIQRTSATNVNMIKNGSLLTSITEASTGLNSRQVYLGAQNNNGATASYSNREQAIAGVGSGSISYATLSSILNGYMTAIGTNVY